MHIEVLRVVYILVWSGLNRPNHSGLKIEKDGAGDVARVVGLVEEDIFAVTALGREVFEVAILVYTVLEAELLPELAADCSGGLGTRTLLLMWGLGVFDEPLLPHWPAWSVIISLLRS
jgi:hypothetical protein